MAALERRFLATGAPRDITSIHPVGLGDGGDLGAGHFAHEGLLKRIVCGTFVNSPKISDLAVADTIEGYTLPQGALSQLTREIAAGRPGLLTQDRAPHLRRPAPRRRPPEPARERRPRRARDVPGRGASVLQAVPDRRLLPARHHGGRGRQRHHGAGADLRRDAVDGASREALRRPRRRAGEAHGGAAHAAGESGQDSGHPRRPRRGRARPAPDLRDRIQPVLRRRAPRPAVGHPGAAARRPQGDRPARRARAFPGRDLQPRLRHLDRHRQRRGRGGRARRRVPDERAGPHRRRAGVRRRGRSVAKLRRDDRPALPVRLLRRRRARPRFPVLRRDRPRGQRQRQPLRRAHHRPRRLHQHQPEREDRGVQRHLRGGPRRRQAEARRGGRADHLQRSLSRATAGSASST